jgi:hypothetical protein
MKLQPSLPKGLCRLYLVIGLAMVFSWLSLAILANTTTKPITMPISLAPALAGPPIYTTSVQLQSNGLNPVERAFIDAVPGSDGREVFVTVSGVQPAGSPIFLNIDPGTGPGNHQDSNAMTISGTTYVATAIGFTPEMDIGSDGDDTMSITTTVGSEVKSTGLINFQRAFVQTSQTEMISVDEGDFLLEVINLNSFSHDIYALVMSTHTPPGPLPIGYRLASSTYNVRPSHSLTQSEKLMTLNLRFEEPLPGGADPHTLAIAGWDAGNKVWELLGGELLDDDNLLTLAIKRFRIYALATTPTWRDSFQELSLTGVSALSNTQWGPGQSIILSTGATSGSVTSIPITPTGAAEWGTLHFSATIPSGTSVTVNVLDTDDQVVLADVSGGTDLGEAGVSLDTYPSLKLRATLTRTQTADPSPRLHEWQVGWVPEVHKLYLPLVIKNGL